MQPRVGTSTYHPYVQSVNHDHMRLEAYVVDIRTRTGTLYPETPAYSGGRSVHTYAGLPVPHNPRKLGGALRLLAPFTPLVKLDGGLGLRTAVGALLHLSRLVSVVCWGLAWFG
jgi:glycerol-3-phosphate acyltransferase PlsY